MIEILTQQYLHMHWANDRILRCLCDAHEPPPDSVKIIGHVLVAENIWLSRITGEAERFQPWSNIPLLGCMELNTANHVGYSHVISGSSTSTLSEQISYTLGSGTRMSSTLLDILCHVPLHGSHHRGQITRLLSKHNVKCPLVDYLVFSMERCG